MKLLIVFLLGYCFTYFINVLDLRSQLFEAKLALKITKINSEIGEWTNTEVHDSNYIGFQCFDEDNGDYWDDLED